MENIKLNLSSQISLIETKLINSEDNKANNIINNISNNIQQQILYYFSYDDQINRKLVIYELKLEKNALIEQKIKYEIKYKEDIGNFNIHLIAKGNINGKIYFIFISNTNSYILYAGIYDLELSKYFPIILDINVKLKEIIKQIPDKDYITICEQNKIFFFGGLIDQSKLRNNTLSQNQNEEESKTLSSRNDYILNKSCIYFDIEKLDFEKQKFNESSLIPRYKLGGMNENGLIYLLGGFTTISNDNENNTNISNNLQFTKFFDDKMHQFNIAKIDEENPKDMIDNDVYMINNRFLISFSCYIYAKIWILDIKTNKGININLKDRIKFEEFNTDNIFFRLINCDINETNNQINLVIVKIIYNDNNKDIKFDIINKSFEYIRE